jgi:hypothetical protein
MSQPENFAILQPLVAATLWLTVRGLKGSTPLVRRRGLPRRPGVPRPERRLHPRPRVGLVFVWDRGRAWLSRGAVAPRLPWRAAFGCFGLYLLVMVPWFIRQELTFGSISPTTSGGSALWIRTIQEWNSITADPSLSKFLAQGAGPILASQLGGLLSAIGNFAVIICSVVLVPFLIVGSWLRRRSIDFGPFFLYTFLVFLGRRSSTRSTSRAAQFIHSAVGLEAYAYLLSLEGVVALVMWIAKRRPRWDPKTAVPLFVGAVVFFVVATAPLYAIALSSAWSDSRAPRVALAREMDSLGVAPDDRLLTIDSAGLKYFTGRPGVVTPDDPIETVEQVARAYGTRWLVLERDDIVRSLAPILAGGDRPAWIGAPVFVVPATDGGVPRLAFFRSAWTTRRAMRGRPDPGVRSVTRREAVLSAALVFVVALVVRWWAASLVVFPKPEDTAYYVDAARNLLSGRGLVSDALWSFQTQPLVVPRAAFEVWLPLPTFLAAVPMALFGSTFAAAQTSSVLIGSIVPVLAWRLAADAAEERGLAAGRARTLAIGTGITAAVSLPLILHSTLPDSTMLFAVLTLAATLLMARLNRRVRAQTGPPARRSRSCSWGSSSGLRR